MSSLINFGTAQGVIENAISLLIPRRRVRVGVDVTDEFLPAGAIEMDASLKELHSASSEIPKHPIEKGSDIADHVRRKPVTVRITGIVTNTPIVFAAFVGAARGVSSTRAEEFYDVLLELKDSATIISVITTLRQYENMLIKDFNVPRDAELGNVVEATIFFEEVITVETKFDKPEPVDVANRGVSDAGKIAPPPDASAATAAQSQSVLSSGAGKVAKFLGF